jgi:hypothetical protein
MTEETTTTAQVQTAPTEQKVEKTPLDYVFKQDTTFQITLQEYNMFKQMLAPFEWMTSILNKMKEESAGNPDNMVPVYEEDVTKDEKTGQMKLKDDFWQKKGKKSLTLEDTKN